MIYDEEQALDDFVNVFMTDFNTCIEKVNTLKNADPDNPLFLRPIDKTSYVYESLDSRTNNFKEFFTMYGYIDNPLRDATESSYIEDIRFTFQVAVFDRGEKDRSILLKKLIRYRRAIILCLQKNPDVFRGYARPIFRALKPDAYPVGPNKMMLTCGVDIVSSMSGL